MISVFLLRNNVPAVSTHKNKTISDSFETLITSWQKQPDRLTLKTILDKLRPTISSALHSFAPGSLNKLLVQAAKLALDSLRTWDKSKKVKPSTYVYTNLQRLNRIRRDRLNIIHIPLNIVYLQSLLDKAQDNLADQLDREPTVQLLSDATGMSQKRVVKILGQKNAIFNDTASLNPLTGQSTFAAKDVTDLDYIKYVYTSVDPVNQKIILWTTPYFGQKPKSGIDIAKKLKISTAAVSQRKRQINNMLQLVRGVL